MPKISIIVPIYNIEPYLRKALDSVVNQTLSDIEIVCIDDCSTDNSLAIVKEYAKKDNRFVIIEQKENQGQGVARNIGIERATGKYIMFLDPDDYFELNACEDAFNQIEKYNNEIVFFNRNFIINGNIHKDTIYENRFSKLEYSKTLTPSKDKIPHLGFCWLKIYNRKFLIDNSCKFTPTKSGEDIPFAVKSIINATSISVLNKPLYNWRMFENKQAFRKETIIYRFKNWEQIFDNMKTGYNLVISTQNIKSFKMMFLIYYSNFTISRFFEYAQNINYKYRNNLLKKVQKMIKEMLRDNDIEQISEIHIEDIKKLLGYKNYYHYLFETMVLPQILSIKNEYSNNIKRKVITVLGIKVKVKVKDRAKTLVAVESNPSNGL